MSITLQCYANCDDVMLVWTADGHPDGVIPGCLGYSIDIKKPDGSTETLVNLKGFAADNPKVGETRPTTAWPLQTYMWTDHTILRASSAIPVTAMMGTPDRLTAG